MRIYKCDICGEYMKPEPFDHVAGRPCNVPGVMGVLMGPIDVCERCQIIGSRIDFVKECTSIWKTEAWREACENG